MTKTEQIPNPFEGMRTLVLQGQDNRLFLHEFIKKFPITYDEAKVIWVSCPEMHERLCRERIMGMRSANERLQRTGREFIGKKWLQRRYKLTDQEVDIIYADICKNPESAMSERFFELVTVERIAQTTLTCEARTELIRLQDRFSI